MRPSQPTADEAPATVRLHAEHGPATGRGAPPLVLLHGFALSSQMWRAQLAGIGRTWPTVAVDLRGCGASPRRFDEPPSMALLADDVAETVDALGLGPVVVCGLSMGGYVAMSLAARHPELLAGLVLADTKAEPDTPERAASRERLAQTVLAERSVRVILDELVPGFTGETTHRRRPTVLAAVRDLVASADPATVAWLLRAMMGRPDSAATLRALAVPALVIAGEEDTTSPTQMAQGMADLIPDAQTSWLPEAGHLASIENPAAFDAAVEGWLSARW